MPELITTCSVDLKCCQVTVEGYDQADILVAGGGMSCVQVVSQFFASILQHQLCDSILLLRTL